MFTFQPFVLSPLHQKWLAQLEELDHESLLGLSQDFDQFCQILEIDPKQPGNEPEILTAVLQIALNTSHESSLAAPDIDSSLVGEKLSTQQHLRINRPDLNFRVWADSIYKLLHNWRFLSSFKLDPITCFPTCKVNPLVKPEQQESIVYELISHLVPQESDEREQLVSELFENGEIETFERFFTVIYNIKARRETSPRQWLNTIRNTYLDPLLHSGTLGLEKVRDLMKKDLWQFWGMPTQFLLNLIYASCLYQVDPEFHAAFDVQVSRGQPHVVKLLESPRFRDFVKDSRNVMSKQDLTVRFKAMSLRA